MRPLYERDEDIQNQERVIAAFCRSFPGIGVIGQPSLSACDYRLRHSGWPVEVKVRKHKRGFYPTFFISKSKLVANPRLLILVGWTDAIGIHSCRPYHRHPEAVGGRTDRGDHLDVEVVIHIPVEKFRIL